MNDILQIRSAARRFEEEFAVSVRTLQKSNSKNKYVDLAKEYVYRHLHSSIGIEEISRYVGLHKDYLSQLFSRCEGITLQHYIRREKVRQAEYMLKYSDAKMDEIANQLAFCSQSHFSHCFKEETGQTPSRYRNQFSGI
ncbi:helix-turn-helix domain-containing protein [Eisenbergiella tayi]|uniref:helix-turn-helix domain-containing protein n=1 Tax=Eisenbergiella tayi TaxID=1432052 RepID=UPI003AB66A98